MAVMGRYCKAYPIDQLEAYSGWQDNAKPITPDETAQDTTEDTEENSEPLIKILYLQENYVVTDGIYKDEGIVFDAVTPEWKQFCTEQLEFSLPKELYEDLDPPEEENTTDE